MHKANPYTKMQIVNYIKNYYMKYQFLFLSISLLPTQFLLGQDETPVATRLRELNNDTTRYVKEYVIGRKDHYIGKPFDTLLRDMPLPLRGCVNEMKPKNRFISSFTIFYFYNNWKKNSNLNLLITWESSFDKRELDRLGLSTIGGKWTGATHNFYENKVIKNVEIVSAHSQIPDSINY